MVSLYTVIQDVQFEALLEILMILSNFKPEKNHYFGHFLENWQKSKKFGFGCEKLSKEGNSII